jgi:hypothetical protein
VVRLSCLPSEKKEELAIDSHKHHRRVLWGPHMDILKKIRKKKDIRMFEFLIGYRSRKKRKFITDSILVKIRNNNDEETSYENFLRQISRQIFAIIRDNSKDSLYKRIIKDAENNGLLFKKFLLMLRLFFFKIFKKRSIFRKCFKKDLADITSKYKNTQQKGANVVAVLEKKAIQISC